MTPSLMILGTHSNAGKSLLVTAFCRILARQGVRVAPFKAQNMSNNAGVTPEGGEMGRAQITQAEAAGLVPHTDMNPVLLKPETGPDERARSQVILNGRPAGYISGQNWFTRKQELWQAVAAAYDRLAARYDAIIMEGAGSPAEINLKSGDIVNLRMARHASAPCLLVGDIDRGGVFAALAGTILLLDDSERAQIRGFLINKFRGDPALLGNATELLAQRAFGIPTLGIIPYVSEPDIPDEDAVALDHLMFTVACGPLYSSRPAYNAPLPTDTYLDIAVIRLPHIANFDEFAVFHAEPNVRLRYVQRTDRLGLPHAVIVPGTKSTLADLAWMRRTGFDRAITALADKGVHIAGICGGYQILGRTLIDPLGLEGGLQSPVSGLDLLPVVTEFLLAKTTHQTKVRLLNGDILSGYEIHTGQTVFCEHATPFGVVVERSGVAVGEIPDGAQTADSRIWGTYLHGIFENDTFRRMWLAGLGRWNSGDAPLPTSASARTPQQRRLAAYERLADVVEAAVDWKAVMGLLEEGRTH